MAIDSANKRRSALMEGLLPVADNTVSTTDGRNLAWLYAGVFALSAEGMQWTLNDNRFHWEADAGNRFHWELEPSRFHWAL